MQIVMIHGQNHRGSTYHIGKMVADALGGTVTEFFLPRDFGSFCVGCNNCFMKDESLCPHHAKLKPITDAMDDADVLILTSPVYVYHATGAMKAFLDHYGYRWMVHRPEPAMFHKQAVCVATAAGAGMRSMRDMQDSLFFWGVPKVYRMREGRFTLYPGPMFRKHSGAAVQNRQMPLQKRFSGKRRYIRD